MNDVFIRTHFHQKKLWRHHANPNTLVVDELGLLNGKSRADIAVINGHLAGFEIKSDEDSLIRLDEQVEAYNAVFDRSTLIVGPKYATCAQDAVPEWWGITICRRGQRDSASFEHLRKAQENPQINPVSVARLLWRDEAAEILGQKNIETAILRKPRAVLYECLAEILSLKELRRVVRETLKKRKNWRCPG
jgi:hypothetical protein